jgi:hypothetical protein
MKELASDENAALEKIAMQLAVIVGAEASTVSESLRSVISGVEPSRTEEMSDDRYVDPENTPYFFEEAYQYNPDEIANPEWDNLPHKFVHDWRAYIPDGLREAWESLSLETKEAVHYIAKRQADQEIWD